MWRFVALGVVIIAVLAAGISLIDTSGEGEVNASAVLSNAPLGTAGFARAMDAWDWQFPRDFGPHPEFQTEWWYYTGNLATDDGRRFGYQFTIFRRAIEPQAYVSDSEWRTNQIYMAHFTVSDIAGEHFYHAERFSRDSAGLAGAQSEPLYKVWLENWQVEALDSQAAQTRITAWTDEVALDVTLEQVKPPALQGQNGLSPKGPEPGNASYYYSLSRLLTDGTVTIGDETFEVTGNTWKDHEFSTSALSAGSLGWDWFGLIFDDGRELMIGQIRQQDGGIEPAFGGLLINADGSTHYLPSDTFTITPTGSWTSPHSGGVYPHGWQVQIHDTGAGEPLNFTATPLLEDQELYGSGITYYEGAVRIDGEVTGFGYVELTGYVDALTGRF
jgi:predicted secreted hydrolase